MNGSDNEREEVCDIDSRVEVKSGLPVSFDAACVLFDFVLVEKPSFASFLCEFCRLFEDLGPLLNGGDVVSHAFAGGECLRELKGGETEFENSLGDVVPSSFLDVVNSVVDFVVQ